jgi:hypothetical protein
MFKKLALTILIAVVMSNAAFGQKKQPTVMPQGTHVLWQEPTDIQTRDLLNGPGGESMKPNLSRVTFIKDQAAGGFSTNYRVKDGSGRIWVAKLGKEAQPETAAVRLMWGIGYATEVNYLVPCVVIEGAPANTKFEKCEGGKGYKNVKFEARPAGVKRLENWAWANNRFSGTKEFQGMIVFMSFINNWDLKDDNNRILYVPAADGKPAELRYIISDLGATFGKTGGVFSRNRNSPESYAKTKFVEGVENGRVKLSYGGKNTGLFKNITVEEAKWLGSWLSQLSDKQISDAFRAANYDEEEVKMLTTAARDRINQLVNLGS